MLFSNIETRSSFRDYLNEWKKTPIIINANNYNIVRSFHVSQPRSTDSKVPRDGNLSKNKYIKLIQESSKFIDITKQFAIIFKDNEFYSGFTGETTGNNITIITAIFRQVKSANKLFKNVSNRYIIEDLTKL